MVWGVWSLAENEVNSYLKDPLTKVYNKYYFNTRLKEELNRSQRYDFPLTLALFHVDQYSELKKEYGKEVTDVILREMGQLFVTSLRSSDLLARLFKDQFVMLLPHTTLSQAQVIWNRLLGKLEIQPFTIKGRNFCVSVHVALTSLNKQIEQIDTLIKNLDKFISQHRSSQEHLLLYAPE